LVYLAVLTLFGGPVIRHLSRPFRALNPWAVGGTCFVVGLASTGFSQGPIDATKFREISVERVNIVEPDGRVRLVLANSAKQAQTVIDGVVLEPGRTRPAGMVSSMRRR
jgi:hypothetical protein